MYKYVFKYKDKESWIEYPEYKKIDVVCNDIMSAHGIARDEIKELKFLGKNGVD